MNNNLILIKLKNTFSLKEIDLVEIFKAGGLELSADEVNPKFTDTQIVSATDKNTTCSNSELICFLNGFIIFKRGKQESKPDQPKKDDFAIANNINNVLLKKLKIALSLTSEDMLTVFSSGQMFLNKIELGALFRSEGHQKYKECSDALVTAFLDGLSFNYGE